MSNMRVENPRPGTAPAPEPGLARAVAHLRASGLLVLPTDTVYGIGALAGDAAAVSRLLAAKGRGRQMPPPVLVAGPAQLAGVVAGLPAGARRLMETFWPGALTLVLDADPRLGWDLGDTGGTIAVRMPAHPLALALLERTGPLAVTSANRTGQAPATDAASAAQAFPGRVTRADEANGTQVDILLLDGGPTPGPVPSTIVSLAGAHAQAPVILREGRLSSQQVTAALAGPTGTRIQEAKA